MGVADEGLQVLLRTAPVGSLASFACKRFKMPSQNRQKATRGFLGPPRHCKPSTVKDNLIGAPVLTRAWVTYSSRQVKPRRISVAHRRTEQRIYDGRVTP